MSPKTRSGSKAKSSTRRPTEVTDDRRAKVEALRHEQARKDRRRTIAAAVVGVATAGLFIAAIAVAVSRDDDGAVVASGEIPGVQTFTPEAGHVPTPVQYAQTPPAGGEHAAAWLNCGTYTAPVPNENAVHSMEHGAVWITYRPDLPAAQVTKLKNAMPDSFGVLSPYPGIATPVVASAWGRQLPLESPDDPRLGEFIRAFRLGDQAPEPGAPCTGGVDGREAPAVGGS
ncbi:DUF3105 domain-containing protein [Sporichthya polymorpha]|uniref:DUF3105 domain-containing protein n=1 Tax=Sporichthya polymorpha TaxID=35751 RepID=UPI000379E3CD|nr:DUF3105 domain-containing protein [Sporichthya polymorpha]